jgi:amino acid transporter
MALVSGAAAAATMTAGLAGTGVDAQKYFTVALTAAIAFDVLACLLIFPSFVALRLRRPDLVRPFRVPGGHRTAWLVTILSTGWTVIAMVCLLWPGAGTVHPDAAPPAGFEGRRLPFELLVLTPIFAVITAYAAHRAWRLTADQHAPAAVVDLRIGHAMWRQREAGARDPEAVIDDVVRCWRGRATGRQHGRDRQRQAPPEGAPVCGRRTEAGRGLVDQLALG